MSVHIAPMIEVHTDEMPRPAQAASIYAIVRRDESRPVFVVDGGGDCQFTPSRDDLEGADLVLCASAASFEDIRDALAAVVEQITRLTSS